MQFCFTIARALAILGIVLNLSGVLVLFRFAMPYAVRTGGDQRLLLGQKDVKAQNIEREYDRLGILGVVLVVLGAFSQIAAVVVPQ